MTTGTVILHPWLATWNVSVHLGFMWVIVHLLARQKAYLRIEINDQKGHAEGERVLRVVATQLMASVRHSDIAAGVGGDEFAVVLPHAEKSAVESFIDKLLRAIAKELNDESIVTCSIGCLTFPLPPPDTERALKEADLLMYQVK